MSAARYSRSLARFAADQSEGGAFECPVCGYTFDSEDALSAHIESEHPKAASVQVTVDNGTLVFSGGTFGDGVVLSGNTFTTATNTAGVVTWSLARAIPCTYPGCTSSFRRQLGLKIHRTLMGHAHPADTHAKGDGPVAEPRVHRGPRESEPETVEA